MVADPELWCTLERDLRGSEQHSLWLQDLEWLNSYRVPLGLAPLPTWPAWPSWRSKVAAIQEGFWATGATPQSWHETSQPARPPFAPVLWSPELVRQRTDGRSIACTVCGRPTALGHCPHCDYLRGTDDGGAG